MHNKKIFVMHYKLQKIAELTHKTSSKIGKVLKQFTKCAQ